MDVRKKLGKKLKLRLQSDHMTLSHVITVREKEIVLEKFRIDTKEF